MIRAVVRNGHIEPIEPLPLQWQDGREVLVSDVDGQAAGSTDDFARWSQDMQALTAQLNDPQDWATIEAVLAEADRQSKALVRREMGLP